MPCDQRRMSFWRAISILWRIKSYSTSNYCYISSIRVHVKASTYPPGNYVLRLRDKVDTPCRFRIDKQHRNQTIEQWCRISLQRPRATQGSCAPGHHLHIRFRIFVIFTRCVLSFKITKGKLQASPAFQGMKEYLSLSLHDGYPVIHGYLRNHSHQLNYEGAMETTFSESGFSFMWDKLSSCQFLLRG